MGNIRKQLLDAYSRVDQHTEKPESWKSAPEGSFTPGMVFDLILEVDKYSRNPSRRSIEHQIYYNLVEQGFPQDYAVIYSESNKLQPEITPELKDIILSFKGVELSGNIKATTYLDIGFLVGDVKNIKQLASPPFYYAAMYAHFEGDRFEQLLRDRNPVFKKYFRGLLLDECDDIDNEYKKIASDFGSKESDSKADGAHVVASGPYPIASGSNISMEDLLLGIKDIEAETKDMISDPVWLESGTDETI